MDDRARGGVLLAFYSLGLGLPFILAAVAWRRALGAVALSDGTSSRVTRAGGVMLVVVGLLLLTGWWDQAVQWLQLHLGRRVQVERVTATDDPASPRRRPSAARAS